MRFRWLIKFWCIDLSLPPVRLIKSKYFLRLSCNSVLNVFHEPSNYSAGVHLAMLKTKMYISSRKRRPIDQPISVKLSQTQLPETSGPFNLSLHSSTVLSAVLNIFWHIIAVLSDFLALWDGRLIMKIVKGFIGLSIHSFIMHRQDLIVHLFSQCLLFLHTNYFSYLFSTLQFSLLN